MSLTSTVTSGKESPAYLWGMRRRDISANESPGTEAYFSGGKETSGAKVQEFKLEEANEALILLKQGKIQGVAVLRMD